jgi:hypothetical protein
MPLPPPHHHSNISNDDDGTGLRRALFMYVVVVLITAILLIKFALIRFYSAFVVALIVGQFILNVLFLPIRLNFWAEFNSSVALYALIQIGTPFVITIYTIFCAFADRSDCIRTCGGRGDIVV